MKFHASAGLDIFCLLSSLLPVAAASLFYKLKQDSNQWVLYVSEIRLGGGQSVTSYGCLASTCKNQAWGFSYVNPHSIPTIQETWELLFVTFLLFPPLLLISIIINLKIAFITISNGFSAVTFSIWTVPSLRSVKSISHFLGIFMHTAEHHSYLLEPLFVSSRCLSKTTETNDPSPPGLINFSKHRALLIKTCSVPEKEIL